MNKLYFVVAKIWKKITELKMRYFLLDNNVVISSKVSGLKHVKFGGFNSVGIGTQFSGNISVDAFSTFGPYSILDGNITIGKYCQFGPEVGVYGQDHPTSYFSININRNLLGGFLKNQLIKAEIEIRNDVWIGHGVIILKGVKVGNGVIIGAGSVVTHSLPSYSIAVGNPARIIKYRFPEEVIRLLETLQWWDMSKEQLNAEKDYLAIDLLENPSLAKTNLIYLIKKYRS